MYDIVVISENSTTLTNIVSKLKVRFPLIKRANSFEKAQKIATTEMFWVVWDDLIVSEDFNFDYEVPKWDQDYIHIFKNLNFFDGICLFPKKAKVSSRELQYRFFIDKKEIDIVASVPKPYDLFNIDTYDEYLEALKNTTTDMFWMSSCNIEISEEFKLDMYFPYTGNFNGSYKSQNHAFIHKVGDKKLYNGLFLLSKHAPLSEREINFRFPIEKIEWDIVASGPCQYSKFIIDTYEDYLYAMKTSKTEMFWMIPKEVEVLDTFKFDLYFSHDDTFNRNINHVFKHVFRGEETYNGISLLSKSKPLSAKEINFRFIIERKEHDEIASKLKPYDVVFISYNEPNAEYNYHQLLTICPSAKRVNGVKGIHNAHIAAAKLAESEMFWVVDGDAEIVDSFKFDHEISRYEKDTVHVWQSKNPINNLIYGYGGVKLLPTKETLAVDVSTADMTTSISANFKSMPALSNVTAFDTDEFAVWKSAFRECVKLSSNIIDRHDSVESMERLDVWCNEGSDKKYGSYAIDGAIAGRKYGEENAGNLPALAKINDFDWIKQQFDLRSID